MATGNEGTIFTPIKEGELLHHAEILTLRQISNTLQSVASELQANRADMTELKVDVAVIKERQTQSIEMKENIADLKREIALLKDRNTKQDGAFSFMALLKDFGPWVLSFGVLLWGLLDHAPPK